MNDISLLDAVERYINGEMGPDERLQFEQLRKTNAEVDQMVVEHTLFMQKLNRFGERKKFKHSIQDIHNDLSEQGRINADSSNRKAKLVFLWNRYKRVTAIAATIAGVTALTLSGLVVTLSPKPNKLDVEALSRKLEIIKKEQSNQKAEVNSIKRRIDPVIQYKSGGTGFMIDAKGYIITNEHVIHEARNIAVQDNKGVTYTAKLVFTDEPRDIAILKIDDDSFHVSNNVPYAISKGQVDLAEPIYTLGYPRNEIVYGQGYLSAKTGFDGDTLSCQIEIAANHGNSGSPILNQNGEVIGILNARQTNAEGFVFAIHSKYIYDAVDSLKSNDTAFQKLRIPSNTALRGLDRVQQVKKVSDYVYMVKRN